MVTPDEQEEFIDEQLQAWKTQMMKTPNALPVLMLTATDEQGPVPKLTLFVVEVFRGVYMELLQRLAEGALPVEHGLLNEEEGKEVPRD